MTSSPPSKTVPEGLLQVPSWAASSPLHFQRSIGCLQYRTSCMMSCVRVHSVAWAFMKNMAVWSQCGLVDIEKSMPLISLLRWMSSHLWHPWSSLPEPKHTKMFSVSKIENACWQLLILLSDFGINAFALKGTVLHQIYPTEELSFLMTLTRQ